MNTMVLPLPLIDPVEPTKAELPWIDPDWFFDFKYHGHRGILYWNGRRLVRCLKDKGISNAIFDGEIIAPDETGRPIFANIHKGHEVYIAFDLLWLEGKDLRNLPFIVRRIMLEGVIAKRWSGSMQAPYCMRENGALMLLRLIENDHEGVVAKRWDSTYGPRAGWVKVLNPGFSQSTVTHPPAWSRSRKRT